MPGTSKVGVNDVLSLLQVQKSEFSNEADNKPMYLNQYIQKRLQISLGQSVPVEVKFLVQNVIVLENKPTGNLKALEPWKFSRQQFHTQVELVDRSIARHLQQSQKFPAKVRNVMELGYGYAKPDHGLQWNRHDGLKSSHLGEVHCHFTNSLVSFLKEPRWEMLLGLIGDDAMLYLLLHTTMLYEVGNDCFVQLTGQPISKTLQELKINLKSQSGMQIEQLSQSLSKGLLPHHSCYVPVADRKHTSPLEQRLELLRNQLSFRVLKRDKGLYNSSPQRLLPCHSFSIARQHTKPQSASVEHRVSNTSAKKFVQKIFEPYMDALAAQRAGPKPKTTEAGGIRNPKRMPRILSQSVKAFRKLLGNYYRCPFRRLQLSASLDSPLKLNQMKKMKHSQMRDAKNIKSRADPTVDKTCNEQGDKTCNEQGASKRRKLCCSQPPTGTSLETKPKFQKVDESIDGYTASCKKMSASSPKEQRILDEFCTIDKLDGESITDTSIEEVITVEEQFQQLLSQNTSQNVVQDYVTKVLLRIVPSNLWGSKSNQRKVLQMVRKVVELGRHSTITVGEVTKTLDVKGFEIFLHDGVCTQGTRVCLSLWIQFLFDEIVVPLISNSYYCTEFEPFANQVFYFTKRTWRSFHKLSMTHLGSSGTYDLISPQYACEMFKRREAGYSTLRILPKKNGYRAICNMSKWQNRKHISRLLQTMLDRDPLLSQSLQNVQLTSVRYLEPVNHKLTLAHAVFKFELERNPGQVGAGVKGINGLFQKYLPFVRKQRITRLEGQRKRKMRKLFFVKVDVRKCFDSMNQEIVLKVAKQVLKEREYLVKSYTVVYPDKGQAKVRQKQISEAVPAQLIGTCQFVASVENTLSTAKTSENAQDESSALRRQQQQNRTRRPPAHSIFTDNVSHSFILRNQVMKQVKALLKDSFIMDHDRVLTQNRGVPQGSMISPILCDLYYGEFERQKLPGELGKLCESKEAILMRQVDDYIMITSNQEAARKFSNLMLDGDAEFGVQTNPKKTESNLIGVNPVAGKPREWISFCGFSFHCRTLQVRMDLSRYHGSRLDHLFSIHMGSNTCTLFDIANRLRATFNVKMHALLLDKHLNSKDNVVFNLIQRFIFCALRFHVLCSAFRITFPRSHQRTDDYIAMLGAFFDFALARVGSLTRGMFAAQGSTSYIFSPVLVRLIGSSTLVRVLRKKQSRYRHLLPLLEERYIVNTVNGGELEEHYRWRKRLSRDGYFQHAYDILDSIVW